MCHRRHARAPRIPPTRLHHHRPPGALRLSRAPRASAFPSLSSKLRGSVPRATPFVSLPGGSDGCWECWGMFTERYWQILKGWCWLGKGEDDGKRMERWWKDMGMPAEKSSGLDCLSGHAILMCSGCKGRGNAEVSVSLQTWQASSWWLSWQPLAAVGICWGLPIQIGIHWL